MALKTIVSPSQIESSRTEILGAGLTVTDADAEAGVQPARV
jgi:hypothetical protein